MGLGSMGIGFRSSGLGFRVGPYGFMEYSVLEGLGAPAIKSETIRIWVVLRIRVPSGSAL